MGEGGLTTATEFHQGNVCPACQEQLRIGDAIRVCPDCGAASHEKCWRLNTRCASYFCRKGRKAESVGPAEIVITHEEAAGLPENRLLPPTTAYPPGRENRHARMSKLAILCVPGGLLASLAMGAAVAAATSGFGLRDGASLLILACAGVGWIAAVLITVFSLARIAGNSTLRGAWLAGGALLFDVLLVVGIPVAGYWLPETNLNPHGMGAIEFREDPAAIDKVEDPVIRRAMRANVVVRTIGRGLMGAVATGSGVVVSLKEGKAVILTNRHVIDPEFSEGSPRAPAKAKVEVVFCGREHVEAEVTWHHPAGLDLALLECRLGDTAAPEAAPVDLASSVAIGADVFAVGNPMEHGWTFTKGVISSVRERVIGGLTVRIFQTQTPINQGNSGGGLYDMQGRLVGINSWTMNKSVAEGLNFAIAVEAAAAVLEPLIESGTPAEAPDAAPVPVDAGKGGPE